MEEKLSQFCEHVFYPILNPVFAPTNRFLSQFYQPYATICAVGMFVGTMLWIGLIVNPRYVNRGRPLNAAWADLRLWTVLSMLPHVLVYFYFR